MTPAPEPPWLLRRFRKPPAGVVEEDGTWVDGSVPGNRELIARGRELELRAQQAEIEAKSAARRHYLRMQTWVLLGVGALILLTILALVLGLWVHAISAPFATELARITLPILLGAAATIVGAFFGVGANVNPGRDFDIRRQGKRGRRSSDSPDDS
ncbi:MAG TPA: hypothetical protein VH969_13820 [Actinophytocola sp.]|jgi:uncharacterized integral membrane protein|uniref:hypothetical protein n=1 Tax=Actinophytocola sp. TaxID=1872138 RepID=UPI002F948CA0